MALKVSNQRTEVTENKQTNTQMKRNDSCVHTFTDAPDLPERIEDVCIAEGDLVLAHKLEVAKRQNARQNLLVRGRENSSKSEDKIK
jgi:hypothetical protein